MYDQNISIKRIVSNCQSPLTRHTAMAFSFLALKDRSSMSVTMTVRGTTCKYGIQKGFES